MPVTQTSSHSSNHLSQKCQDQFINVFSCIGHKLLREVFGAKTTWRFIIFSGKAKRFRHCLATSGQRKGSNLSIALNLMAVFLKVVVIFDECFFGVKRRRDWGELEVTEDVLSVMWTCGKKFSKYKKTTSFSVQMFYFLKKTL